MNLQYKNIFFLFEQKNVNGCNTHTTKNNKYQNDVYLKDDFYQMQDITIL